MCKLEFTVRGSANKWYVDTASERHGPYLSRYDATADAIDAAYAAARTGCTARVLVQERGGAPMLEWTSGVDPYPPKH